MKFKPWFKQHKSETVVSAVIRHIGAYAFVRMCRNKGIAFEDTYFMLFNKFPTR